MEDFRTRQLNDRAAALEAKYDPEDDIATSRLGVPIEAGAFLGRFTKNLKDSNRSGGSMGGSMGGTMGGSV